jgi:hypothetical protein
VIDAIVRKRWNIVGAIWLSSLGTQLHQFAIPILVFQSTNSTRDLALAFFFETIPWATSGPLLARRLSRYSRRQTLITLDLARSALVFAVCLVPYDTNLVLFIMFLLGNGNAAYAALRASGFKGIFATSEIDRAISWSSMGGEAASFAGPLIGAMLLSAGIAARVVLSLDAVLLLTAAMIVWTVPFRASSMERQESAKHSAIGLLWPERHFLAIGLSEGLRSLGEALYYPTLIALIVVIQGQSEKFFGWTRTILAAAGVLATVVPLLLRRPDRHNFFGWFASPVALLVVLATLTWGRGEAVIFVASAVMGYAMSVRQLAAQTIVIKLADERQAALQLAQYNGVISAFYCFGYLAAAIMAADPVIVTMLAIAVFAGLAIFDARLLWRYRFEYWPSR